MKLPLHVTAILLLSLVAACGGSSNVKQKADAQVTPEQEQQEAQVLYSRARKALDEERALDAVDLYQTMSSRYPFSEYARQSQLEIIYAHFLAQQPVSAVAAADRFIRQYPRHPAIDYVYYLRGLVDFERSEQTFEGRFGIDSANRDPTPTQRAFESFQALLNGYPNSPYTDDARLRMSHLRERMARHELGVADYYVRTNAYVGALRRAEYVIEHFQNTRAARDALGVMEKAYRKLQMFDLAADVRRTIEANVSRDKNPPLPTINKPLPPGMDAKLGQG